MFGALGARSVTSARVGAATTSGLSSGGRLWPASLGLVGDPLGGRRDDLAVDGGDELVGGRRRDERAIRADRVVLDRHDGLVGPARARACASAGAITTMSAVAGAQVLAGRRDVGRDARRP